MKFCKSEWWWRNLGLRNPRSTVSVAWCCQAREPDTKDAIYRSTILERKIQERPWMVIVSGGWAVVAAENDRKIHGCDRRRRVASAIIPFLFFYFVFVFVFFLRLRLRLRAKTKGRIKWWTASLFRSRSDPTRGAAMRPQETYVYMDEQGLQGVTKS